MRGLIRSGGKATMRRALLAVSIFCMSLVLPERGYAWEPRVYVYTHTFKAGGSPYCARDGYLFYQYGCVLQYRGVGSYSYPGTCASRGWPEGGGFWAWDGETPDIYCGGDPRSLTPLKGRCYMGCYEPIQQCNTFMGVFPEDVSGISYWTAPGSDGENYICAGGYLLSKGTSGPPPYLPEDCDEDFDPSTSQYCMRAGDAGMLSYVFEGEVVNSGMYLGFEGPEECVYRCTDTDGDGTDDEYGFPCPSDVPEWAEIPGEEACVDFELCDGKDNDCDGEIDEECVEECEDVELCDGLDNDCNGIIDDNAVDAPTWYLDADGDLFGNPNVSVEACGNPGGYSENADDCNDNPDEGGADMNPGKTEVCDGVDNDCDGLVDEDAVDAPTWYLDADNDKYSDGTSLTQCDQPDGYKLAEDLTATTGDCNDDPEKGGADMNPGKTEVCDGVDNNCVGGIDDGVVEATISESSVFPQKTSGNKKAGIAVWLKDPVPEGKTCTIDVSLDFLMGTGGHKHAPDAIMPKGSVSPETLTFSSNDTDPKALWYTSGEVSGELEIVLKVRGANGVKKLPIDVKVPYLYQMSGPHLRLTGETTTHPDNHYATVYTITSTWLIAEAYYEATGTTLGINDMSLKWGGLLDINGNWLSPHSTHRTGEDVDIDRNVWNPRTNSYILINCKDDKKLRNVVIQNEGRLQCEPGGKKHVDF